MIKSCPYCKCNVIIDHYVYMQCSKCLMTGPQMNGGSYNDHSDYIDRENAIKAWNNLPRSENETV